MMEVQALMVVMRLLNQPDEPLGSGTPSWTTDAIRPDVGLP